MPFPEIVSASLLSLEKRKGWGRGGEVVVSPLGFESVRCSDRGRDVFLRR